MGRIAQGTRAKVLGISVEQDESDSGNAPFLPQRIALLAQGNSAASYSLEPFSATGPQDIIARGMGYGSIADLCATLGLWPRDGDTVKGPAVTVYPLQDDGAGAAATGSIGAVGNVAKKHAIRVRINKQIVSDAIALEVGEAPAASVAKVKAALDVCLRAPFTTGAVASGAVPLTCKWKGTTGNSVWIELIDADNPDLGPADTTVTWTVTQLTGGSVDPSIDAAIAKIGDVWETVVINTIGLVAGTLDSIKDLAEAKWNQAVSKPFIAVAANVLTDVSAATATGNARTTDRGNCCVTVPGSKSLPFVIAARAVAARCNVAHEHPADDRTVALTGIDPGPRATQWKVEQRELAFSRGGSTVIVADGVRLGDLITFYKPTGQDDHGYRHAVDIFRLQNALFQYSATFLAEKWDGAPLVKKGQPTPREPRARTEDDAITDLHVDTDTLAAAAIVSDPEKAKKSAKAWVVPAEKRLNWEIKIPLSSNSNVVAGTLKFSLGGGF